VSEVSTVTPRVNQAPERAIYGVILGRTCHDLRMADPGLEIKPPIRWKVTPARRNGHMGSALRVVRYGLANVSNTSGPAKAGCKGTTPSAHTASDGSHRRNQMWGPP
jgi:hypothetical protein